MKINVFIADDHSVVRTGLRFILEAQHDITVVGEAVNGRDTVRQMHKLKPDVVLMDITMPDLNGIDATQQIREVSPSTKVIILSMHSSHEHISRAMHAGALGYLLKESDAGEVVNAVRAVHAGRRFVSQVVSDKIMEDYSQTGSGPRDPNPLDLLSPREREIIQLVAEGKSSAEIATMLFLSPKTVETYRSRLMEKLNIHNLPDLIKFAVLHGLTSLE